MQSAINEDDQVMTLLGSLPSSYDPLVATLGAQVASMSLSTVERSILDEEARKVGSGRVGSPGAVAMYGKTESKKSQGSGRPVKMKAKCFTCKQPGHFQRDCPKNSKAAEDGIVKQQANVATIVEKAVTFVATSDKIGTKKFRDWIVDSGASRHMTWDRGQLEDYRTSDKPELVRLGDNHVVEAQGIGNVRISVALEDGRVQKSVLCDVLYVHQGFSCQSAVSVSYYQQRVSCSIQCGYMSDTQFRGQCCQPWS